MKRYSIVPVYILALCLLLIVRVNAGDRPEQEFVTFIDHCRLGNYKEAEQIAVHVLANAGGDEDGICLKGKVHRILASMCSAQGRKSKEIEHLYRSYCFYKDAENSGEQAEALRLIGSYYLHLNQVNEAEKYLKEAQATGKSMKNTMFTVDLLSNMAQLEWHRNNLDRSRLIFEKAISLASKIKYDKGLLISWDRLAYAYFKKGDSLKMRDCIRQALKHITKQTHADTVALLYSDMGWALAKINHLDSAEWYLQTGLTLIKKGNNVRQEMLIYERLSELRQKQGRVKEANEFLRTFARMQDEFFTSQLIEEMSDADARFKETNAYIKLLKTESRDSMLLIGLISAILLLLAFSFIIYWLRHQNQTIRTHEKDMHSTLVKLSESEKRYRQVFEGSLALIGTHTLDGSIISVNRATELMMKCSLEEMQGSSMHKYIAPAFEKMLPEYLREIKEKGESHGWVRVVDSTGETHLLRYQNKLIDSAEGPIVIAFAEDQTEIFRARSEVERGHRRMTTIMDNSPDTFIMLTKDEIITYINRTDFLNDKDVVNKNIFNFMAEDEARIFREKLTEAFSFNTQVEFQATFKGRYYLIKLVPMKVDGRVSEMLSISTDITNQKKSEIELKIAKDSAEESSRLKTIFLGSLSHEVRTPLQGILGVAELLESKSAGEAKQREFIQIIKNRAYDMQNIIESLLDMASLETGEIKSLPVNTNLYQVLRTVYEHTGQDRVYQSKPIKLLLNIDTDEQDQVFVDPQHLQQVLINLLRNAVKFTEEGVIILASQSDDRQYIIRVIDTGIGITPEKLDQIFKPFRQVHEGLSRSKGGIGLGLAICKKMVEMWNGEISVESTLGKGSSFTITVPKQREFHQVHV